MDNMQDEKALKLQSIMELLKELKGMEGDDLPGKPKVMAVDIHAEKMPGEMEEGSPMEESMESPEEEAQEDSEGDLSDKLPPALQELLKQHLRSKM